MRMMNPCHSSYLRIGDAVQRLVETVCLTHDSQHYLHLADG